MATLPQTVWSSYNNSYFGAAVGQPGPQGARGPVGPTGLSVGLPGVPGPAGPIGGSSAGPTGATGPRGIEGAFGPQGIQGTSVGASGATGPTGAVGPIGSSGGGPFLGTPNTVLTLSGSTLYSDISFSYGVPAIGVLDVPAISVSGDLFIGYSNASRISQESSNTSSSDTATTTPLTVTSVSLTNNGGFIALNSYPALLALCSIQIQPSAISPPVTANDTYMYVGVQVDDGTPVYNGAVYAPGRPTFVPVSDVNLYVGTGGAGIILLSNVHYTSNSSVAKLVIVDEAAFSNASPGLYGGDLSIVPI
jgi:hypothetical protein